MRRLLPAERVVEAGGRADRDGPRRRPGAAGGSSGCGARYGERADAVVFGHSHLPLHEERDGFQIFNPGSPTERRRAPRAHDGDRPRRGRRRSSFELVPLDESR